MITEPDLSRRPGQAHPESAWLVDTRPRSSLGTTVRVEGAAREVAYCTFCGSLLTGDWECPNGHTIDPHVRRGRAASVKVV